LHRLASENIFAIIARHAAGSPIAPIRPAAERVTARTHGTGRFSIDELGSLGDGVVIEEGVLIFNPAHVHLADGVYVGHRTMLKGDTRGEMVIGEGSWIGQDCYFHSAGGISIGRRVGIGPRVMMLTSTHVETPPPAPIIDAPIEFAPIEVSDGCDIGIASILLPGVRIGTGSQIGAGSVVTSEIPDGVVASGVPARVRRRRGDREA
jgi:acetyltransferase-like isoleucine patch superfamily enzyme